MSIPQPTKQQPNKQYVWNSEKEDFELVDVYEGITAEDKRICSRRTINKITALVFVLNLVGVISNLALFVLVGNLLSLFTALFNAAACITIALVRRRKDKQE